MIRPVGRLCLALLLAALLAGGILPVVAAVPAPEPASKERVDYLELRQDDLKSDLNSKLDALEKRIDDKLKQIEGSVKDDIEKQDKRVADLQVILGQQASFGQWLSIGVGLLEIILLFLGALVGYLGYKRLSDEGKGHLKEMRDLLSEMKKRDEDASTHHEGIKNKHVHVTQLEQDVEQLVKALQNDKDRKEGAKQGADSKLAENVKEAQKQLDEKPTSALTAKEWFFRAISSENFYAEIAAYDELIGRFVFSQDGKDLVYVARAQFNKGCRFGTLNESEKAIASYSDMQERFAATNEPEIQELVAKAWVNKGNLLWRVGRTQEAIASYNEVLGRFESVSEPASLELKIWAMNGKSFALLNELKRKWAQEPDESRSLELSRLDKEFAEIIAIFEKINYEVGKEIVLGNRAYTLFLAGRKEDAKTILCQALKLGGEKILFAELTDADTHPIPAIDEEFKTLVKCLWNEIKPKA